MLSKAVLNIQKLSFISLLFMGLSGCALPNLFSKNDLRALSIEARADANRNNPVMVDLVFIQDADRVPNLLDLTAPEWFAQKSALLIRYSQFITVMSVEAVPLYEIHNLQMPENHRQAESIVLFANFLDGTGQQPIELSGYGALNIVLESDGYRVVDQR